MNGYQITALPVVVPLGVLAFTVLLWRLRHHAALTFPRALTCAVLCVYGAGVVANTALPITLGGDRNTQPWWTYLNLTPGMGTDPMDMLQNVAVFVPLGFLLPLLVRDAPAPRVALWGFLFSFGMEALQLANAVLLNGGHVADVNDLLANTLGAPLGYGLFRAARLVPAMDRLADAAGWPRPYRNETAAAADPRPV